MSKYGTEFYRLEKRFGESSLSIWSKLIRSLRSTGIVREKRICLSQPTKNYPEGREFSWGWKSITQMRITEFPKYIDKLLTDGWELKSGQRRMRRDKGT